MKMKWITLFPDSFLWVSPNNGFIYNSKKFKGFSFKPNNRIQEICHELLLTENLYSARLFDYDMKNIEVEKWIYSIVNHHAGYVAECEKRPISFKPMLKIQSNIEYYMWEYHQGDGSSLIQNIHDLTFYINGSKTGDNTCYLQTLYPLKSDLVLDAKEILSFILNSRNPFLLNINLVGNIFAYPKCNELIDGLDSLEISYIFHIKSSDFIEYFNDVIRIKWSHKTTFNIIVDSYFDINLLVSHLKNTDIQFTITCVIFSDRDYDILKERCYQYHIDLDKIQINPIYNNNYQFFRKYVFTNLEDIEEQTLSKRDIFIRQSININYFGKLITMPDGQVFADVNKSPLGKITDSPYSLTYKEFTEKKSWFRIRNQAPCNDCVYQWLCPSPSNYETVIGRPNLCHVKQ